MSRQKLNSRNPHLGPANDYKHSQICNEFKPLAQDFIDKSTREFLQIKCMLLGILFFFQSVQMSSLGSNISVFKMKTATWFITELGKASKKDLVYPALVNLTEWVAPAFRSVIYDFFLLCLHFFIILWRIKLGKLGLHIRFFPSELLKFWPNPCNFYYPG